MTMTKALTPKQRAKINAALLLIQDLGGDAKGCIQLAMHYQEVGRDTRTAFQDALNAFIGDHPDMAAPVGKALKLIDASDSATVAKYDEALSDYATTGNSQALDALAPMIAQDSLALAIKSGEITREEAATADLSDLLGFEAGPALDGITAETLAAQMSQPTEATTNEGNDMTNNNQYRVTAPTAPTGDAQVSLGGVTGYVTPKAAANWARNTAAALPNGAGVAPAIAG